MKKHMKRGLCLLLVVLLCFSLTGCLALDDMRKYHATLQKDGTLLLDGQIYVPLPYCEEFTPPMGAGSYVYVTEPDVPVLLADTFAITYYTISETAVVGKNRIVGDAGRYYCVKEDYDALDALIQDGADLSKMQYYYGKFDEKEGLYTEETVFLSEEQVNAVKRVLATVEPFDATDMYYEEVVSLNWCSEDGLFSKFAFDLCKYNGHYALVQWEKDTPIFCEAPAEYNAIFAEIMRPYLENGVAFGEEYWY